MASQAQIPSGNGTGLTGEYFANATLSNSPILTRQDSQINFQWDTNSPAPGLPADQFSVRWSGQLEAPVTGLYTLKPIADDGMRLFLSGKKIAEIASGTGQTSTTVQVRLTAGQRYPLQVEYFERYKKAMAALRWSYSNVIQEVIPTSRLYPRNQSPLVSLSSPASSSQFTDPATISLAADARDPDGTISKVEFFAGATRLGEDTTAPYSYSWSGVPAGTYSLTVKATDNAGVTTTSAPVSVNVVKPNFADVTEVSPASVAVGESTTITTRVTCTSGALADGIVDLELYNAAGMKVAQQFWVGQAWTTGEQRVSSFIWKTPDIAGTYTMKVGVFRGSWDTLYFWDDQAATVTVTPSAPANTAPAVDLDSPRNGASYTAPATIDLASTASDEDGTISKVEFFAGSTRLGEDTMAPYSYSWSGVPAGTYSLTAKATDNTGASTTSAPVSVVVNPPVTPSPTGVAEAPTNLRIQGIWDAVGNRPTDVLTWDPVPGAVSYNIYQYDMLIGKGVTSTTFTVPSQVYVAYLLYMVAAVDANGMESIPSNLVLAQGAFNPAYPPPYLMPSPTTPANVRVYPEWNLGRPRVRLTWYNSVNERIQAPNDFYNVYRDGVKVASGLWGLVYIDNQVQPGETHSYQVIGANMSGWTLQESVPSAPLSATAPIKAPALQSNPVTITSVIPNDDSVVVTFSAVPGAADYRCYPVGNPSSRKYSGGGLRIEVNGINPAVGADLVVEAVDKLGPYQKHDGFEGPGVMQHDGSKLMEVNGQGDPSNVPNVLARSQTFHVNCQPRTLAGEQVFFDTFRNSQPFVWAEPPASLIPNANGLVKALQNDKWLLLNVQGDLDNSQFFVQGNHFMDTFYDGDRPGGRGPLHNNVASFLMTPRQSADISGGKVLHVTFEVDPHMGPRRWCDLFVAEANDPLIVPGKFFEFNQLPTVSGNLFRWELLNTLHSAQLFKSEGGLPHANELIDDIWGIARRSDITMKGTWNGNLQDLDLRHRFDLYLSQTRFRLMENGTVIKDGPFPNGATLPFTNAAVYFVHQVYHTGVERPDLTMFYQDETYWYNHRPYMDERHWDNMGFEVLSDFPALQAPGAPTRAAAPRHAKPRPRR